MNHTLRFSVIVIFYNQRAFVRSAMDSALNQNIDGVEVIAVDDGSTDGTREVLNEYRDRAHLVFLDKNRGACAARNAGTAAATGDYVAYLDGDDVFMPWAFDTYRRIATEHEPTLMMGPMRWFEGDIPEPGPVPERLRYVPYDDYFSKDWIVDISASAIVVRRRSLELAGQWHGFPVDDLDLLYRLGTVGPFVQITEPYTTWHRSHGQQVIHQTERLIHGVEWLIANDKRGRYPGGNPRRLERRACIGDIAWYWARRHAELGSRGHALRFLARNAPYVLAPLVTRTQRKVRRRKLRVELELT